MCLPSFSGLVLVTTPFSLLRLLSCHCFLFLRLGHLVLDEADRLFTAAPDEVSGLNLCRLLPAVVEP